MPKTTPTDRILRVDLLRGWFMFVIIIDHTMRFPGIYDLFTGRGWLWASAAEGFFFLSGMMVGMVYGRRRINKSFKEVSLRLWRRAGQLYIYTVGASIIYTILAMILAGNPGLKDGGVGNISLLGAVIGALSFRNIYGWADFLQYYAVFMVFAPAAIWLLRKKLWSVLLAISVLVWAKSGVNIFLGWQILFFGGCIVGFYREQIEGLYQNLTWRKWLFTAITTVAGASYIFNYALIVGRVVLQKFLPSVAFEDITRITGPYFNKPALPTLRIMTFLLWFMALYLLAWRYEEQISKKVGWLLLTYGRNSLQTYLAHSVVIFIFPLVLLTSSKNILENFAINTAVLLAVWVIVKYARRGFMAASVAFASARRYIQA